jgi:hypothetical protein
MIHAASAYAMLPIPANSSRVTAAVCFGAGPPSGRFCEFLPRHSKTALDLLFVGAVNFYEVLADGYHSPLTKTQITALFQAGRLRRNHPCKLINQKNWRTIDELFPLLKYQSAGAASYYSPETDARSSTAHILIIALLIAVFVTGVWFYFRPKVADSIALPSVTIRNWPKTISSVPTSVTQQTANIPSTAPVTVYAPPIIVEGVHETNYALPTTANKQQARLAEQQRQAEQRQREQDEQNRLAAERANVERKAAGHDLIIPLDEDRIVSFGGMSVRVKIHDNDVTTFDVWINGEWHRAVQKQKGISHSGTDETLIYNAVHARLYFVWEISGTLNHCRLRIRED